jgi:hypothetical protein
MRKSCATVLFVSVVVFSVLTPAFADGYHGTAKWIWATSANCAGLEGGCALYRKAYDACGKDGEPSLDVINGRAFYAPIYYPGEPAPGGGLAAELEDVNPAISRRWDCKVKVEHYGPPSTPQEFPVRRQERERLRQRRPPETWVWATRANCVGFEGGCSVYEKTANVCQGIRRTQLQGRGFARPIYYPDGPTPGGGMWWHFEDVHPAIAQRWDCRVEFLPLSPTPRQARPSKPPLDDRAAPQPRLAGQRRRPRLHVRVSGVLHQVAPRSARGAAQAAVLRECRQQRRKTCCPAPSDWVALKLGS